MTSNQKKQEIKIIFFGTPDFAVASLEALLQDGWNVVAVITAPDKPAGRGHKLQPSPVKSAALTHQIPVLQPSNLKDDAFQNELREFQADLQFVVAFRMLPEAVWNMPRLGTYNVHASLLPNYRGAAPINWAIVNGELKTGVTTFKLKHEIDTGNILKQRSVEIGENETAGELYERLMKLGAEVLIESVREIASGDYELKPQEVSESNRSAPKIFKEDCRIDLKEPAKDVHNFIRGLSPFPGAFLEVQTEGKLEKWKIYETRLTDQRSSAPNRFRTSDKKLYLPTMDKLLEVIVIQIPGKKRMDATSFLNGFADLIGNAKIIET